MTTTHINFKQGTIIELSFASIIEGKEKQLYEEYFPKVIPIVSQLGGLPLGSYIVTESSSKLDSPEMGALFQWESIDAFKRLHDEPRFKAIKGFRDGVLKSFINGLFYTVDQDITVAFEEGEAYALIAPDEKDECCMTSALIELQAVPDTINDQYSPSRFRIVKWNECCDKILTESYADIFKLIFNPSK